MPARIVLGGSIVVLGIVVLAAAGGGLTRLVAGVGSTIGSAVDVVTASASPTPLTSGPLGIPTLEAPVESYTNRPSVDLTGQLPGVAIGGEGFRIRIYVTLPEAAPTLVTEVPVPTTAYFTIPGVALVKGANEFTATIVDGAGTEGEPSLPVRYVLDTSIPKAILSSPEDGEAVPGASIDVVGKTQQRSTVTVRNTANGATATAIAASDGTFRITLAVEPGKNPIVVTTTDPAGNVGTRELSVTRGSDAITASLRASGYRFSSADLPAALTLTATATDPTGAPLAGAAVTFSVSFPGLPVITSSTTTDAAGTAVFQTTVPLGATPGSGPATAFISSPYGTASPRLVITIE